LFFSGAALGFYMSPMFFKFFLQFQPPGTAALWSYANAATFLAKMLLVSASVSRCRLSRFSS
jgi:Sec-independent protein secretion pathway component TatC